MRSSIFNFFKKKKAPDEKITFNGEYFAFLTIDQFQQGTFNKGDNSQYKLPSKTLQKVVLYKEQNTCENAVPSSEGVIVKIHVAEKTVSTDEKENAGTQANTNTSKKPIEHHYIDSTIWVGATYSANNNVSAVAHTLIFEQSTVAEFLINLAQRVQDRLYGLGL